MKKQIALAVFLAILAAPLTAASNYASLTDEERQKLLEEHYARALQSFNDADYSRAISYWQKILEIDPEQAAPPGLIKQAREKLSAQLGPNEKELRLVLEAGQYDAALKKTENLSGLDPSNQRYKLLKTKLENIVEVKPAETGTGKAARLIRKGLSAYLADTEDPRLALNALRYARDINPQDPSTTRLVGYMETQYPDVAKKETVAPGMSVTENKLFIALNNIYEGRYDLAVLACNEVLELEPDNVLALKRKGSAYFALNQKDKAREIWALALKITPNDAEIKKFLASK
ncbi:MAG TPA: tetratricopeptide repeat protein [Elusimicrobiota bacterium]|nr:tetratricopeptide repeat protein [Elusimicrobiota bacterium]